VTVERADFVRGYEIAKNQYIQLIEAELESLETESSNNIELKEFIPLSKIDPVYFESAYYLGAGEGGENPIGCSLTLWLAASGSNRAARNTW
jgi:DNA end-binding protein Ku